jgi:hypothetical protein
MNPHPDELARAQAELLVLRAMCQDTSQGAVCAAAISTLKDYHWHEAVHQVMFYCLVQLLPTHLESLRRELPGCLTRRGFPDVELEMLFEPHPLSRHEAELLMRRLIDP